MRAKAVIGVLILAMAGCGDDGGTDSGTPDSGRDSGVDSGPGDGGNDAGPGDGGPGDGGPGDGGGDAGIPIPTDPVVIAFSEAGHDRVFGVTHDDEGNVYATGQIADGLLASDDFEVFVAKVTPAGTLDESFGDMGLTRVNLTAGGTNREIARAIVIQSSGRIVIGATAEHDPTAAGLLAGDTDIVLVGFTPDGDVDDTFGDEGIDRIDVGTGVVTTNPMGVDILAGADSQWGLALDSMDRLVVHGVTRAPEGGSRTDTDFALLRRLEDGGMDGTFGGGDGLVTLDIDMANTGGARSVTVLSDDSIIGAGYVTTDVLMRPAGDPVATSQQPVLYRVTSNGTFDATFATTDAWTDPGVWHDFATPLPTRLNAEAYGAAVLSDGRFITIGYGPTPVAGGMGTDWVSFRFSEDGDIDGTYGGGDGSTYVDFGMAGDNGRFIMVLPDDRTLSVGAGRPVPPEGGMLEQDGAVLVLSAGGVPDEDFGAGGFQLHDLGGNDHFWSASVDPVRDGVVVIGGIAAGETVDVDDDNAAFLFVTP